MEKKLPIVHFLKGTISLKSLKKLQRMWVSWDLNPWRLKVHEEDSKVLEVEAGRIIDKDSVSKGLSVTPTMVLSLEVEGLHTYVEEHLDIEEDLVTQMDKIILIKDTILILPKKYF